MYCVHVGNFSLVAGEPLVGVCFPVDITENECSGHVLLSGQPGVDGGVGILLCQHTFAAKPTDCLAVNSKARAAEGVMVTVPPLSTGVSR